MHKKLLLIILLFVSTGAFAQYISGEVLDNKKQPVIGAVIQVLGTKYGSTTDLNGKFRIKVAEGNYKVKISYTGLSSSIQEIKVGVSDIEMGNFILKDDPKQLDEFVKVGYGVQRKRELTSAIGKISGKELNDIPVQSFEQGMQGKLAGVVVTQGSGLAGSPSIIRIRGISSLAASGDPLYVIDGIPISQDYGLYGNSGGFNVNPLSSLNPDDIESVEVLKDAAATSIYGSRGANGVVMVTTKRAKEGSKLVINYTGQVGFSTPTAKPNMLSTDEFLQLFEEAWINDGNTGKPDLQGAGIPISWDDARKYNTDWLDLTTQVGVKQNHNISLSKGWKKLSLMNSFSYSNNETFIKGNAYERINERINLDYQVNKKLHLMGNMSYNYGNNNRVYSGWSGGFGMVMSTAMPFYPVYNPDGSYFLFNNSDANFKSNPVMMQDLYKWNTVENRVFLGGAADYEIIKNLTARIQGNYDYQDVTDNQYGPQELMKVVTPGTPNSRSRRETYYTSNSNYSATINYLYDLNVLNHFTFMGGYERQRNIKEGIINDALNTTGFITSNEKDPNNPTAVKSYTIPKEWIFERFFGRVNYNYNGRYFAGLTFSYDGSSKFGDNNKYGLFPAASIGWIISEEDFLQGNKTITFLKVRTSYGKSGNSGFDPNAKNGYFQYDPSKPYNNQPILYPSKLENQDLKWETTWTFDIGLDYGMFNDRVSGSLEYYHKRTADVIAELTIDPSNGFSTYYDNIGIITNQGIEFSIKTRNIDHKNFRWTTDFNIARNFNELTSTGNYTEDAVSGGTNDTRAVVGKPVGTFYLVRFSHVDKENGKPVYLDKQGNQTYTWSPDYRVPVGSVLPLATGGITNTFQWKSWDLGVLFTFQLGGSIYDASAKRQMGVTTYWNMRSEIADRWQKPGDDATFPRLTLDPATYGLPNEWQYNTPMWLYDASFVRLRSITLGYNIPTKFLEKTHISKARLAFIGTNLFVFTNYPGLDPEIARDGEGNIDQSRNLQAQNVYYLNAPQERTYNFQISISF